MLKLNSTKLMFLMLLIMSTLFIISSNSWLNCWIGLEMNLLSMIPIMKDNLINYKNMIQSEVILKYFITQTIASMNFLFIILMMYMKFNLIKMNLNNIKLMMNITMLIKMGGAPFHFWFPKTMEGLSWMNCLILSTWQKIAPMILISYMMVNKMILFSIICSMLIGSLGGLNQTSLRKIISYSSINHLSWMLIILYMNNNLWNLYFLIYSFMNFMIIMIFKMFNLNKLSQLNNNKLMMSINFYLLLNLLSLGGLPPFLGFSIKWLSINLMMINKMYLILFMLTMTTLISLFYYLQINYSTMMLKSNEIKWLSFKNNNYKFIMMKIFSLFSMLGLLFIYFF